MEFDRRNQTIASHSIWKLSEMEVEFKRNNGYNIVKEGSTMKKIKKVLFFAILLSVLFSFNSFAMKYKDYEYVPPMPSTEKKYDDRALNSRWTWMNDDLCVRFQLTDNGKKADLEKRLQLGLLSRWVDKIDGEWKVMNRQSYSGKWSQSEDGIRSFTFDDYTIPVGVTKVDGVLYAFNTYGELKAGYEYYTAFKTEADGIVKADSAEFTQWLATQYLPDCTSHE